jgi:hypothetical protein
MKMAQMPSSTKKKISSRKYGADLEKARVPSLD